MRRAWFGIVFVLLGCSAKPAGPNAAASARPAASAAPAGSTAPASASSEASAEASKAKKTVGYHLVAESNSMVIYPLGEDAVVDTGAFYSTLGSGKLVQDPAFTRAAERRDDGHVRFTNALRFGAVYGAAPNQLLAERGDVVYARVDGTWTALDFLRKGRFDGTGMDPDEHLINITPWGEHRALAAIRMPERDVRFQLVNSKGGGVVPGAGEQVGDCKAPMDPARMKIAGLPDGHLFAVGHSCADKKPAGQVWEPGNAHGKLTLIEGMPQDYTPFQLVAVSGEEAYAMFTKGALATWDGSSWKRDGNGDLLWLLASPTGAVWGFGQKDMVFKHRKGGAWTRVDLGVEGRITSAWGKGDELEWIVVGGKKLFHRGDEKGKAVQLPTYEKVGEVLGRDKRWLATPFCNHIFVMLATIGRSGTTVPHTHAGVTKAVKDKPELQRGVEYVVDEERPSLYVGAMVPNVKLAEKIAAAYKEQNEKANPVIYCYEPTVKGKLDLE